MAQVKKATRKTIAAAKTKVTTAAAQTGNATRRGFRLAVSPQVLLGEIVGTAILASVAITGNNGLFVGLTYFVVVLALASHGLAHANPAVTFGLWAIRRFETAKMLLVILAQLIGGLLAFVLVQYFARGDFSFSLASFSAFDGRLFMVEVIGTAILVLGVVAALDQTREAWHRALAVGLSLVVGLSAATGFLGQAIQGVSADPSAATSRLSKVDNVALNPAVALAMTERRENPAAMFGEQSAPADTSTSPSRFTLETVGGALAGGVLGAALYTVLTTDLRRLSRRTSR